MNRLASYRKIYSDWMKYGKEFFWGDPMDFRFLIVSKLSEITVENVLDVGCNMGLILNNVDSKFKIGIDIDFNSLKAGKKTYPDIEFVGASAEQLPFREKSIKFTISIHTIDQFAINQKKAVNEIIRTLDNNGKIFLTGDFFGIKYDPLNIEKENTYGWWINNLKETFSVDVKYFLKPKMIGMNAKFLKFLLIKLPNFLFNWIKPDKILYQKYEESSMPIKGNPYVVLGEKTK